ncbi:MAG: hypothetical protein LBT46_13275 [Planctomycetaceae bacterium]|jgi:hypothetical protein|nr:hypothetical protein [Planctomycetaceae bacterium]
MKSSNVYPFSVTYNGSLPDYWNSRLCGKVKYSARFKLQMNTAVPAVFICGMTAVLLHCGMT